MKLSIITPTFNSERFIVRTIASINQFYLQNDIEIEHIIIDGGSTDSTIKYAEAYSHPSTIIIQEKDDGMYDAINKGMKLITGDIWACLNSDDEYNVPAVLEALKQFEDPLVTSVYADVEMIGVHNELIYKLFLPPRVNLDYLIMKGYSIPILQPAVFIRTSLIKTLGYFNTNYKYASDYDYLIRLNMISVPKHIDVFTTKYRIHNNSITWNAESHKLQMEESYKISDRYKPFAVNKNTLLPNIDLYLRQMHLCNLKYMLTRLWNHK